MANVVVIGGTGDVGRGIVQVLLEHGHRVLVVARQSARLSALTTQFHQTPALLTLVGSVESEAKAEELPVAISAVFPSVHGIVASVNAARNPRSLLTYSASDLASVIGSDLITHFTAAKALLPILTPKGVYIGIGGGSADLILEGGAALSVAQAGLRMLYRGLAHEYVERDVKIKELIIASVVNGASTRSVADPHWVTDTEIGAQVAAMLEQPDTFPGPIWRMARRSAPGARPAISAEAPTRVQGFKQPQAT